MCALSGALREEHLEREREREPGKLHQGFERNEPRTDPHPSRWLHQAGTPALGFVPGYDLLEEIGRGGMGVVFRARQICLNRIVAVKLMLPFSRPDAAARFRVEAETAASLHHPNIVAIHDAGEHAGQLYYSMDYVVGRSLAEVLQDGPLPAGRAAQYVETIARAVHYAHQKGFLHRDLKPSNILIDEFDQPRITDFGLAKRFQTLPSDKDASVETSGVNSPNGRLAKLDPSLTQSGEVVGSPSFIAPEQAERRLAEVGPASDIFSLGAVLYHALVGSPPFQGESLVDVLDQVVHQDPIAPRKMDPSLSRDLEALCLKCLAKDAGQRYGSGLELADELRRIRQEEETLENCFR